MIRRVISILSLFLFMGLASLPLFGSGMICSDNCCTAAMASGCEDEMETCVVTVGNERFIFPLVSAPLSSYHSDDIGAAFIPACITAVLQPDSETFHSAEDMSALPAAPVFFLTPLRI